MALVAAVITTTHVTASGATGHEKPADLDKGKLIYASAEYPPFVIVAHNRIIAGIDHDILRKLPEG